MTSNGYNVLAALALLCATAVALIGNTHEHHLLAMALVGGAFTVAGRGSQTP